MQHKPKQPNLVVDTPQSRRNRLRERLKEISNQGDKELAYVMEKLERAKLAFRAKRP